MADEQHERLHDFAKGVLRQALRAEGLTPTNVEVVGRCGGFFNPGFTVAAQVSGPKPKTERVARELEDMGAFRETLVTGGSHMNDIRGCALYPEMRRAYDRSGGRLEGLTGRRRRR